MSLDANVCDADSAVKSQLCLSPQRRVMQRTREWRPFAYKENKTEATAQIKALASGSCLTFTTCQPLITSHRSDFRRRNLPPSPTNLHLVFPFLSSFFTSITESCVPCLEINTQQAFLLFYLIFSLEYHHLKFLTICIPYPCRGAQTTLF